MSMADSIKAPIHKNRQTTMSRISNFFQTGSFFRTLGLTTKLYPKSVGYTSTGFLRHLPILGPHGTWKNYDFQEDIKNGTWNDAQAGQSFGPTWTTHWFHVKIEIPSDWTGSEVHFRFASGTEACVYDTDGNVLQGISPGYREEYIVGKPWTGTPAFVEFYVEMACNGMFGAGDGNDIAPPRNDRYWTLANVDVAVFDREVFNLITDLEMLHGISDQMSNSHIGYQAMFVANEMVNLCKVQNDIPAARALAAAFFREGVGSKAHTLYAMGHCHIDTAWLWPYDETIRKCARSFSAQLQLIEEYPDTAEGVPGGYKFVCSSAQQYAWVKEYYPSLYTRIKTQIAAGKFIPVGGTWIEMDGNIPSGEGFMRQYYYGQKFYQDEFGITCKEFWLPDTFGYSAQIPQMLDHVGITRFLTQKMSWSLVNKFPNHNFWWEGIDGTQVMVHFPPGDSYNMNGTVNEILNSQNNSLDKGRANCGVYLYGYGDGGGGPTRQMIERLKRVTNVDGLPKVTFSDSNTFFDELEKEQHKFSKWVGELYLELHNGTYTSQARIKWYNRKGEFFLREVEMLMAMAYSSGVVTQTIIDADLLKVDKCWQDLLLNQFHDVLPGSCIEFAAQDAWTIYEDLFEVLRTLRKEYNIHLLKTGTGKKAIYSSLPWERTTVVFIRPDTDAPPTGANTQQVTLSSETFENQGEGRFRVPAAFTAALVKLNPCGFSEFAALAPAAGNSVIFTPGTGSNFGSYSNGLITLEVSKTANNSPVEALFFGGSDRLPAFNDYLGLGIDPAMFYIYDDVPMYWDAWDVMDYHLETRRVPNYTDITIEEIGGGRGPLVGGYKWTAKFGNGSSIERYAIMRAQSPMIEYYTIVDWKEDHKMLKVEFPIDVLSRDATFEIQYGHAKRPTHMNTSWDMAKYEVCGHKWMDISQADKGVSVITDSKYGWHVRDNHVQLSLLKSPKNPDGNCDMHKHYIYYAVMPHKGTFQSDEVIQRAYELNTLGCNNVPLISTAEATLPINYVVSSNPAVIAEAVKVARTQPTLQQKTICFRLYEAYGGYAKTTITFGFDAVSVTESNGLEVLGGTNIPLSGRAIEVTFKPFQIRTFLVTFA